MEVEEGVTFIVPCFEQSEYLAQCLASLVGQTVKPFEIIVVDDGSGDDEADRIRIICEQFGATRTRVTNRGLPNARNTGLMLTRSFAVTPIDADDWLREDYIELTYPLLADFDVVLTGLQEHGPTRNGRYNAGYDRPWREVTKELLAREYNRFFYAACFRADTLKWVGGWNGRMIHGWEDFDLWYDLLARDIRFTAVDEPLLNYRTRPDSMLQDTQRNWQQWNRDEMARHHQTWAQR